MMRDFEILLKEEYSNFTSYTSLLLFSDTERHIFFWLFLLVALGSLFGNLAAIYSMIKRKARFIQKVFIISLALSDIVSTVSVGVNNIETLSHPLITWNLGEFLCSFIPLCQFWGMTASSFALVIIAMDRYRNVVHALSRKWDPKLRYCVMYATAIWLLSLGISSPMATFYTYAAIDIVFFNETSGNHVTNFTIVPAYTCISFRKHDLMVFYISTMVIIFVPLLSIFVWLYYNVAKLIWKHRKPLTTIFNKKLTKRSKKQLSSDDNNNNNNSRTTEETNLDDLRLKITTKNEDIRMERKIRTFKIIITLMLVFLICRLPTHIFTLLKLIQTMDGDIAWIINFTFNLLNLVNCLLTPLLYTFLNQTLNAWNQMRVAINEILFCCCSSTEFDEFERGNPFVVDNFKKHQQQAVYKCTDQRF